MPFRLAYRSVWSIQIFSCGWQQACVKLTTNANSDIISPWSGISCTSLDLELMIIDSHGLHYSWFLLNAPGCAFFDRCILTYVYNLSCDTKTFYCSRNPLCPRVSCFPKPVMSTNVFTCLVLSCLEHPRGGVIQEWAVQGSFIHPSHAHAFNLSVQLSCSFLCRVNWHLLFACTCHLCTTKGQLSHVPIFNNSESNCLKCA